MTIYSVRRLLTVSLAAVLAWTPASTGFAAGSAFHFSVDVDQTQTLGLCGFSIRREDVGTLQFVDRFDADGNLILENAIFTNWRITFTNPANGKSVTSIRAYNEQFVQYDDGSFKAVSAGLVAQLVVPGEGQVVSNVGIISVLFDSSAEPVSVLVAGEHDGPIAQFVCSYLA
jgi:hypothetical protein